MSNKLKKYNIFKNISDDKLNTEPLNKTLFVFYTSPTKYWKYEEFPSGWSWIGSGRTKPVGSEQVLKYTNEEQFSGPPQTQKDMIQFLEHTFEKLKEEKAIESFKIKETCMYELCK